MLVKFSHKQTNSHIDFTHHQDQQLYFSPHVMTFCAVHKKDILINLMIQKKQKNKTWYLAAVAVVAPLLLLLV